ncbi:coagulation factor XI-like isoform X2 [Scomber scombrus]|uniref:coagulation factor XI-like isoform X2 n=1 Tax=Scomber scombrus TaxID=13677 RepID=UPI002DDA15EE|nr:coagulation factor XI-like isoform X2 [Scomber scombrus]
MGTNLILVFLLSLCSISFSQECSRGLLEDVDFPGTDITFLYSPDVNHCQLLCTEHASCQFFTFVRPDWTRDDRHFYCYLKSTPSGQPKTETSLLGVTSGFSLKNCFPYPEHCISQVYKNVDFLGADYRSLFTSDYEECQRVCTKDPGCKFFTFVNANFQNERIRHKCHLKYTWTIPRTPIVERTAGVVSGFTNRAETPNPSDTACQGELFSSTDIRGSDFEMLPAASPEHCQTLCSAHPRCTYFSYDSNDLKCYLKSNANEMVTSFKERVTSGLPAHLCQLNNSAAAISSVSSPYLLLPKLTNWLMLYPASHRRTVLVQLIQGSFRSRTTPQLLRLWPFRPPSPLLPCCFCILRPYTPPHFSLPVSSSPS